MKTHQYELIDEKVFEHEFDNGLKLFIIPKPGFQKTYVTYTTQFGSLDNHFKPIGSQQFVKVPDGVAHFLEHKLFEKEDEDLFMVETPYFTEETVNKEKGIIAEEIKMYQEQPGYKLMFNTLRAMYSKHPIRVDIAGSVESIYEITKDDLYLCYETFYHPSNMVLFVVGDVSPQSIIKLVEKHENQRNKTYQPRIERAQIDEPREINQRFVSEKMKLQSPRLMLGFKNEPLDESATKFVQRDLERSFINNF